MHKFNKVLLLSIITAFALTACEQEQSIPLPVEVQYHISSPDPEVEKLVFNYFGDRVEYKIYSDSAFTVTRNAEVGLYQEWVNGDSLWIQEKGKTYAVSCLLNGVFLEEYLSSPLIKDFIKTKKEEQIAGVSCKHGYGITSDQDSIDIYYAPGIPNAWVNQKAVPGMPLKYIYKMRGSEVVYEADVVKSISGEFQRDLWGRNTIEQSPLVYLGLTDDTLGTYDLNRDVVNVRLFVYDQEEDKLLPARLQVTSSKNGDSEPGAMVLQEGNTAFLLEPGAKHTFMVSAQGYAPKRIDIDLSQQPKGLGQYDLEMEVGLFKTESGLIIEYLSDTPMGIAEYDASTESINFDLEYTSAVNDELTRLQALEQNN